MMTISFNTPALIKSGCFTHKETMALWQCSKACHDKTYDNEETVRLMIETQNNMKIPSDLIPKCPVCGAPMTMNLRCDHSIVQAEVVYAAAERYKSFIRQHKGLYICFWSLVSGQTLPCYYKISILENDSTEPQSHFVCINYG